MRPLALVLASLSVVCDSDVLFSLLLLCPVFKTFCVDVTPIEDDDEQLLVVPFSGAENFSLALLPWSWFDFAFSSVTKKRM